MYIAGRGPRRAEPIDHADFQCSSVECTQPGGGWGVRAGFHHSGSANGSDDGTRKAVEGVPLGPWDSGDTGDSVLAFSTRGGGSVLAERLGALARRMEALSEPVRCEVICSCGLCDFDVS